MATAIRSHLCSPHSLSVRTFISEWGRIQSRDPHNAPIPHTPEERNKNKSASEKCEGRESWSLNLQIYNYHAWPVRMVEGTEKETRRQTDVFKSLYTSKEEAKK